jgi:hypothetical protein
MTKYRLLALAGVFLWGILNLSNAADLSSEQMLSLDEQVQEVKSDVLSIAAELGQLEERLLYPTNTQVAVFVSMPAEDDLRLDAVQVEIDGQLVAHYIYSFKELEALRNGGVQRLYTGNVNTGRHQINVTYSGKLKNGKEVTETEQFDFDKGVKPKMLGLNLAAAGFGASAIELQDW